jgi:hypothetical protein
MGNVTQAVEDRERRSHNEFALYGDSRYGLK